MTEPKSARLDAQAMLDAADPGDDFTYIQGLLKTLKIEKRFGLGQEVAALALQHLNRWPEGEHQWLRQQYALCTYKNEELPAETRLDQAMERLLTGEEDRPREEWDSETLSLAGAIRKRQWEATGDRQRLEQAGILYVRAIKAGVGAESVGAWTYAANNAAFVFDLLVDDLQTGGDSAEDSQEAPGLNDRIQALRERATQLRHDVLQEEGALLSAAAHQWWGYATLAEAAMGLHQYDAALAFLSKPVAKGKGDDWERESTARQLAALADLQSRDGGDLSRALDVLAPLVAENVAKSLVLGRIGLALSGGGFRAAFYHVGVLARLAELDLLRWVDTLSCVSGGSITGALYYLALRRRLEAQADLSRRDYVELVQQIADILTDAVSTKDFRFWALFTRRGTGTWTRAIGRALQEDLFNPANGTPPETLLPLNDLRVTPEGDPAGTDFHPRLHNWRRQDKVPILIVNATALNTGHNWQFTASWMGEPPTCIETKIDASGRLRRFYFSDPNIAETYRTFPLSDAVAASACVPFAFRAIELPGLYPDRTVRLVDGGVNDNQGVFGLDEQGCSVMIVSDGSGQLKTEVTPSRWLVSQVIRSNDILMQAQRRSQFKVYDARMKGRRVRDLIYIHMKKGIEEPDVTWIGGKEKPAASKQPGCTLHPEVQKALAETRTDLDRFSRRLAHALMYAGYDLGLSALVNTRLYEELADQSEIPHRWSFRLEEVCVKTPPPDYVAVLKDHPGKFDPAALMREFLRKFCP